MRRLALCAPLAAALAACSPGGGAPAGSGAATAAAPATPATAAPAGRYVFAFAARDPAREDPRITGWIEDDCGAIALAAVDAIPMADAQLRPDVVIEFDTGGRELQRWGKPFGAEILGVSGNRLVFGDSVSGSDAAWWTDASGAVGPSEALGGLGEGTLPIPCPSLAGPGDAGALQCHEITDQAGLRRRLAWEGACS